MEILQGFVAEVAEGGRIQLRWLDAHGGEAAHVPQVVAEGTGQIGAQRAGRRAREGRRGRRAQFPGQAPRGRATRRGQRGEEQARAAGQFLVRAGEEQARRLQGIVLGGAFGHEQIDLAVAGAGPHQRFQQVGIARVAVLVGRQAEVPTQTLRQEDVAVDHFRHPAFVEAGDHEMRRVFVQQFDPPLQIPAFSGREEHGLRQLLRAPQRPERGVHVRLAGGGELPAVAEVGQGGGGLRGLGRRRERTDGRLRR